MSSADENTTAAASAETPATAKPKRVRKPAVKKAAAKKVPAKKAPAKKTFFVVKAPAKKAKAPAKKAKAPAKKVKGKALAKAGAKKVGGNKRGQGTKYIAGPLYVMIRKALPESMLNDDKSINMKKLAPAVKTSMEGVYKWFRTDRVAPDKAMRLIKATKGKLKETHFIPFVFGK